MFVNLALLYLYQHMTKQRRKYNHTCSLPVGRFSGVVASRTCLPNISWVTVVAWLIQRG